MVGKHDGWPRGKCFLVIFGSLLILGGLAGQSPGAAEEERVGKLVEGARSEGKMYLYTTQNIQGSMTVVKKFEEKYPFIKVEMYRAATVNLLNRILSEARARKYTPDVMEMPGFQT